MKTITMLEFRRNATGVLRQVQRGRRLLLTYRGKPVVQMEPVKIRPSRFTRNDPLFKLLEKAEKDSSLAVDSSLSNDQIDRILYGKA